MSLQLDFTPTRQLLQQVNDLLDRIEGFSLDQPDRPVGPGRRNNPELAQITRDVMAIADYLSAASAEARVVYQELKGSPDPRRNRN